MWDESRISSEQRYQLLSETVTECAFITLDAENRITDWSNGAEHLFGYTRAEVLNREVRILHTPEDCEVGELERDVQTALADGRNKEERWHVCKDGSRFWGTAHRIAARSETGELLGYVTVVCDLTQRVQVEQEAEHKEQLHAFLLTLSDRLRGVESAEEVIRTGAEMIGRQIRASGVWYGEVNADQGEVKISAVWEDRHAKRPEVNGPGYLADGMSEACRANRLWVVSDIETDGRSFVRRMLTAYRARGVRATIGIPIHRNDSRRAVLLVESAHPRPWTPTEVELISQATDHMLTALDARGMDLERNQKDLQQTTAKLMQVQEDAARELARDLHDSISQQLAVMGLDLARVRTQLAGRAPEVTRPIAEIERQASALAEEVRMLSHRLHPSVLHDLGLVPALKMLAREFERAHGIAIALELKGLIQDPPRLISTALYRIAQEALQNVAKHAKMAKVLVTVFENSGALHLFVEDTGPGFDRSQVQPGLGLISMQERSNLAGGELYLDSSIGGGTTVHFVAPLA